MAEACLLVGGGGHGKVVLETALVQGLNVVGVVDPRLAKGATILDVPVLGGDEVLDSTEFFGVRWLNGIGANPDLGRRRQMFEQLHPTFRTTGVCHPSVIVGREAVIGGGVQLLAGAVIQTGTRIGENCVVGTGARIDHDCQIEAHSFIGPGVVLCGNVLIDHAVFIGAGAIILPGIRVARGAIIGAGAVVNRDVPGSSTLAGNPGRVIG